MNYAYNGYNPLQGRMENLMQQKQMIEQQLQSLQNMSVPPININNNMTPTHGGDSFDFNGIWVTGKEQATGLAKTNKPLIMFDSNNPIFYMNASDGTFKEYRFEEVVNDDPIPDNQMDMRMGALENKLDSLINSLGGNNNPSDVITPKANKNSTEVNKKAEGGKK